MRCTKRKIKQKIILKKMIFGLGVGAAKIIFLKRGEAFKNNPLKPLLFIALKSQRGRANFCAHAPRFISNSKISHYPSMPATILARASAKNVRALALALGDDEPPHSLATALRYSEAFGISFH